MKDMREDVLEFINAMLRYLIQPTFSVWVEEESGSGSGDVDRKKTTMIMAAQLMIFAQNKLPRNDDSCARDGTCFPVEAYIMGVDWSKMIDHMYSYARPPHFNKS
jgi:hypothetical protein